METLEDFIKEFKADSKHHITHDGRDAWRTFAPYQWFSLKCRQFGFKLGTGIYEATNGDWRLSYCEGDVTLSQIKGE